MSHLSSDHQSIDQLVDQLRHRPVATTAAQMRDAANRLEQLQAAVVKWASECSACHGTGTNTVTATMGDGFEIDAEVPCSDCEDIREYLK